MLQQFCKIFATWYCHQPGVGLAHVVSSLDQYFAADKSIIEAFELKVIINDPVLIMAENALIKIVQSKKAKVQLPKKVTEHAPNRRTDWSATKIEHICGRSDIYIAQKNLLKPDILILGVLRNLAMQWVTQLEKLPYPSAPQQERLSGLQEVCRNLHDIEAQPWQPGIMAKLMRLCKSSAYAIYEANDLFRRRIPSEGKLEERLEAALNGMDALLCEKNQDALFEWYCALLIAKTATHMKWRIDSLAAHENGEGRFAGIFLRREGVVLRIAKGYPRDGNKNRLRNKNDEADVRKKVLFAHGIQENGYQPDMVLTFWHFDDPSTVVTYIADAKNGSDSYFAPAADKAIAYYFYFADLFVKNQDSACSLLFSNLNVREYKGFSDGSLDNKIHPPVIALNALGGGQSGVPVSIKNWFEHISLQATAYLYSKSAQHVHVDDSQSNVQTPHSPPEPRHVR